MIKFTAVPTSHDRLALFYDGKPLPAFQDMAERGIRSHVVTLVRRKNGVTIMHEGRQLATAPADKARDVAHREMHKHGFDGFLIFVDG